MKIVTVLLTLCILVTPVNIWGAPCNGNGQGGGNKCADLDEVSDALDEVGNSITDINEDISNTNNNISSLNLSVSDLQANSRVTNRRLDRLEESKHFLEIGVRVADTKNLDVELYNSYDWRHRRNYAFGMKFIFKPGMSYEEKLIQKQERQIYRLEMLVNEFINLQTMSVINREEE